MIGDLNSEPKFGTVITCSVCNKEFKYGEEHKYIINKGYTCSWSCFLDFYKKNTKPAVEDNSVKPITETCEPETPIEKRKRGRPKKVVLF